MLELAGLLFSILGQPLFFFCFLGQAERVVTAGDAPYIHIDRYAKVVTAAAVSA